MSILRPSLTLLLGCAALVAPLRADTAGTFRTKVQPLLNKYCVDCHGADEPSGDVRFAGKHSLDELLAGKHTWYRVLDQLEFQTMPPEDAQQPNVAERKLIAGWIQGELTQSLVTQRRELGRSQFRRLTRAETTNAFADLFGVWPDVDKLPADGRVRGYTKVSDALPMSMDGAYGYYTAADELFDKWVLRQLPKSAGQPQIKRFAARSSGQSKGHTLELPDGWWVHFNTDDTSGRIDGYRTFKTPGRHKVRMNVYGYQTDKPLPFGVYIGTTWAYPQKIQLAAIAIAPPGKPAVVEVELDAREGQGLRLIPFGLGVQVPKNSQAVKCKGPGLAMQWVEVEGPPQPVSGDAFLTADLPESLSDAIRKSRAVLRDKGPYSYNELSREEFLDVMRTTFRRVGAEIFRRDLRPEELDKLLTHVEAGLDQQRTLHAIFQESIIDLLTSPEFFCVIESPGELGDFELATRLSLFLWNSVPDKELLDLARQGRLSDPKVLRRQTDRLLDDPRSERFVADFLDQWLDLHAIDDTTPDGRLYPEYDDQLKFSSVLQTRAFFARVLRENRSVRDFVAPDWLAVNARLAEHYGISGVSGAKIQYVRRPADSPYGGLWTQPVVLKVTADGSSTSPVKRGVWISERLLGVPISPPPPNIEPIQPDTRGATTLREQLALHSGKGSCANCHQKFDPFGFALESFDVMGQYRQRYRELDSELASLPPAKQAGQTLYKDGLPVDATGVTPEGETFDDIVGLRKLLAERPEKLAHGVASHLLTYATATPTGPLDRQALAAIVQQAKADDYGLRSIVHGVVQSELFRYK